MAVVCTSSAQLFRVLPGWPSRQFILLILLEHLAAVLRDQQTAGQFKSGFRKRYDSLAPYTKPEAVAVQASGLRTVATLKPKYHCLSCSETCLNSERKAHTKKTGHVFCTIPIVAGIG
jgi:hypothetical protein